MSLLQPRIHSRRRPGAAAVTTNTDRDTRESSPRTIHRLVIPGPFMMGWVVDVPRGVNARTAHDGGRND